MHLKLIKLYQEKNLLLNKLLFILLLLSSFAINSKSENLKEKEKDYYLVDSLNLKDISQKEIELIDTSLELYYQAIHDTDRINAINNIIENSWNQNVWPKYNIWLHAMSGEKYSQNKQKYYLESLAGCVNNFGFLSQSLGDMDEASIHFNESLKLYIELKDEMGIANCYNNIGYVYEVKGDVSKGLNYYYKSLEIRDSINDLFGIANSLNNIGYVFMNQGSDAQALEYFLKSLAIREELGDQESISILLNNIGLCYEDQGDFVNAINYFNRSLEIDTKTENKEGIAVGYSNIGDNYFLKDSISAALHYYNLSLNILLKLENSRRVATLYNSLADVYRAFNQLDSAYYYNQKALELYTIIDEKEGLGSTYNGLANTLLAKLELEKAEFYGTKSLVIARELGFKKDVINAAKTLYLVYEAKGDWEKAFSFQKMFYAQSDSLRNQETKLSLIRQQDKYQFKKQKALEVKNQEKQLVIDQLKIERKKNINNLLYLAFSIVIIVLVFYVRKFYVKN